MPRPWTNAPIDETKGIWTVLMDVEPGAEKIVGMVVYKGSLHVATDKKIYVLREPRK